MEACRGKNARKGFPEENMSQKTYPVHLLVLRLQFSSALTHYIFQFLLRHLNKRKVTIWLMWTDQSGLHQISMKSQKITLSKYFPVPPSCPTSGLFFKYPNFFDQVPNTPSVTQSTSVSFWIYKSVTGDDHCSFLSFFQLASSPKIV